MRVIVWGTYDLGKPRTRILLEGLLSAGVEVIPLHGDIWRGVEDKSQLSRWARAKRAVRWFLIYPALVVRYVGAPGHDAVVVPYMGQLDVLVLKPFAWLRRKPVVWDMFISLYDTVALDRRLVRPDGFVGRLLKGLERCACRSASLVLLDTQAHARYVERILSLPSGMIDAIPVGVEREVFPRVPARRVHPGPLRILFYGQLIPLHGVRTILEAALSPAGQGYTWHLIGTGQERGVVESMLRGAVDVSHIKWEPWVEYRELIQCINEADLCLGIFGDSEKAASVIPNKVYQALAAGRPVITRDSAAMRELFPHPPSWLQLVPPSDPDALLKAVARLHAAGCPSPSDDFIADIVPEGIGRQLRAKIEKLVL